MLLCVDCSQRVTHTLSETEGFLALTVIIMDRITSSSRKSWLAQSMKTTQDTSMLKVRNEIPIVSVFFVMISHQTDTMKALFKWEHEENHLSTHTAASHKYWSWMHHNHRGKHHNGSLCAFFFSAVRLSFCSASCSLCCSQCFVTLSRERWNWHIVNIVPSAVSQLVIKM